MLVDTDFQIGQSNNEEITVSIGDIRPERIKFTQRTVPHVGLVSSGASLEAIDNGVNQQTLVVQVGNEVPRTISINKGDDARTISDKINQPVRRSTRPRSLPQTFTSTATARSVLRSRQARRLTSRT